LPSLDELRARIIGLIQAPATKIAQVVNAPAAKLARVVQAYAAKSGEGAAA
jgi:large subunit ribosomal protein L10